MLQRVKSKTTCGRDNRHIHGLSHIFLLLTQNHKQVLLLLLILLNNIIVSEALQILPSHLSKQRISIQRPPNSNIITTTYTTENDQEEQVQKDRRQFLLKLFTSSFLTTLSSLAILTTSSSSSQAAETTTIGESLRRSAANVPGYGPADIYYPAFFLGKWNVVRDIVEDPILMAEKLPVTLSYSIRFIATTNNLVVADREYNEVSYYNALCKKLSEKTNDETIVMPLPLIRSTVWSVSNPNVLTISYVDGSSQEIKVTKRASEIVEEVNVSSSEFRRITKFPPSSEPLLSASRVRTKWRKGNTEGSILEAIEVVYNEGSTSIGDPMMIKKENPQLASKSRLRLERIQDN